MRLLPPHKSLSVSVGVFHTVELENATNYQEKYGCPAEPPCESYTLSEAGNQQKNESDGISKDRQCFHSKRVF